jgi:hypothetical protein
MSFTGWEGLLGYEGKEQCQGKEKQGRADSWVIFEQGRKNGQDQRHTLPIE